MRAISSIHGYTLAVYVVGSSDGYRTLFISLTAPTPVPEKTLLAAALSAGTNVRISPGFPEDALDMPTRILNGSAELVTNPGSAPYMAMRLVDML